VQTKNSVEKRYDWLMGADMYMAACIILCEEMLLTFSSSFPVLNITKRIDKQVGFTSANPDDEMLLPAVFNFKHGLELYLKVLVMAIKNLPTYKDEPPCHDLKSLIKKIRNLLKDKEMFESLNAVESIVDKYYYGSYAFVDKSDKNHPDKSNEAERYPERKNTSCYQIKNLETIVSHDLLKTIIQDCRSAQGQLRKMLMRY